ncbi:MAG: hypothetical protein WAO52_16460 [Prolixibacteraceae bacterium]
MKKIISILFLILSVAQLNGQTLTDLNHFYKSLDSADVKTLDFRFESMSFFHNTEWMGDIVDGYTWTGAWVRPKLSYAFSEKLKVDVGGHFLRYHSRNDFTIVRPWFSAEYQMFPKMKAVFGNLNLNQNQGLVKQLWEPERMMTDAPREGVQFLYDSKFFEMQNWMSWEQFILPGDPYQEHFTFGLSGRVQPYSNSMATVKIPIQLLVYHQGGEIDSSPLGVVTHYNYATGLETNLKVGDQFLKNVDLNFHFVGYECPDGPAPYGYDNGHGYSVTLAGDTRFGKFSFDYWNAYQYIAPYGKRIYMSISDRDINLSQTNRSQVAFNYMMKQHILKDIEFAFQGEALYDLLTTKFSFAFGYYLVINQDFLVKRF